ncbi:TIGR04338 family metallohydrolase [Mycolicibacterium sarraceniae]|uniref:TIGR04338 family metallohydrolase n=1 Tax=Mycolicibacterium sarraceniae TaxID=1534348 RepID=A0A7I7SS76_9MYCO|nr:TIGR04338 family metallohydrolase [Mycolicibacterium sarraceniae]BBY58666.1 hypothetical protein MSAR_18020 [Mycolicibacterium sarraceniae]
MTARDSQRSRVYGAEEFVRTLFDRAAQHSSRTIDFFGAQLTLPPEARFASMPSVRRYVGDVLALPAVSARWPQAGPLTVRTRRAASAAHYESSGGTGIIAVPDRDSADWAMRELVVLHEIAHHLSPQGPAHGPDFIATFCELATVVMGPEVGHVLRVVYAKEGVK